MIINRRFPQLDWITGEGHTAQTADIPKVSGKLHEVEIKISSVTGNPTVTVTLSDISDTDFVTTLETFSTLADGTLHKFFVNSKEYDGDHDMDGHVFCENDLRISVDPSADPGGEAQTLAVDVTLYIEQ